MNVKEGFMRKWTTSLVIILLVSFLALGMVETAAAETKSLVRIYIKTPEETRLLPRALDVAGWSMEGWIDVVATSQKLLEIQATGLPTEIIHRDLESYLRSVKGFYRTFPQLVSDLQSIASSYPAIAQLDTVGWSYESRPLLVLKISDNVGTDEAGEPELFFMGLHHAREWPSLEIACFIADTLTAGYGVDADITDIVDSREIWIMPCVNPDGYVYCHDLGNDWRKNRHYFPQFSTYGVDLNRNYNGSCNGDPQGAWGTTGAGGGTTHYPNEEVYCGPYPFSEIEIQAVRDFFLAHDFVIDVSYHTYGEIVIFSWGYSGSVQTPDHALLSDVGAEMASRITQQDGTGTYGAAQSPALGYTASGDTDDWAYGYHHYIRGTSCIGYTVEACNQFHPSESYLDQIVRENFDGALYLCDIADSVAALMTPRVMPPILDPMDTVSGGNYTVSWSPRNPDAGADVYQLDELEGLSVITDDAEGGSGLWDLAGFSVSTTRYHSSNHSFRSSSGVDEAYDAMTTVQPYLVSSGDSLTFWCWYDIEEDWDMAYAEVSTDGRCYELLETFTGASGGWVRKAHSLEDYLGRSVYFRFRHTTDSYVLEEGIYVDDINPVASYSTTTTLSSSIADTFYAISGQSPGDYAYRVKGHNDARSWGDWSCYEDVTVTASAVPPERVVDLAAQLTGSIYLSWSPVVVDTAGSPVTIDHYVIHRDSTFDFATSTANSLAVTADTFYLDVTAGDGNPLLNHFYLVRAVDDGGNKSENSNMVGEFDAALMNNP
jgi:carboxypeptidase T